MISIKFDSEAIIRMFDNMLDDKAKKFFYNELYREMQSYVPADTLAMFDTVDISSDGILFVMPYSSAPYYGITKSGKKMHFKTDKHALATDHWDKAAWAAKQESIIARLQEHLRERNRNNG